MSGGERWARTRDVKIARVRRSIATPHMSTMVHGKMGTGKKGTGKKGHGKKGTGKMGTGKKGTSEKLGKKSTKGKIVLFVNCFYYYLINI